MGPGQFCDDDPRTPGTNDEVPDDEPRDTGFMSAEALSASRMVAFSDGVFAVAITLLVLSVNIPPNITTTAAFHDALRDEIPALEAYVISFTVISAFWLSHHRCFMLVRRVDERLLILNLVFLGAITLIPFPTELIGDYGDRAPAVMLYGTSIGLAGLLSAVLWWYISRNRRLIDPATPPDFLRHSFVRGFVVACVFMASVPLALINTRLPLYFWLAAGAVRVVIGRRMGSLHRIYRLREEGELTD